MGVLPKMAPFDSWFTKPRTGSLASWNDWFKQEWNNPPIEFWQMAGIWYFLLLAMIGVSSVISPFLWGKNFDVKKRMLWHTTFVALFFQIFITGYMMEDMKDLLDYLSKNTHRPFLMEYQPTQKNWLSFGAVVGYVAADFTFILVFADDMMKSMGRPLYWQMFWHHVGVLLVWPYGMCSRANVVSIVYWMFTESSSIFMNIRWCAGAAGADRLWLFASIGFFFAYTAVRVVPLPFHIYYSLQLEHQWSSASYLQMVLLAATHWVPMYLNLFWYSLIVKGLMKFMKKDKGEAGKKKVQ